MKKNIYQFILMLFVALLTVQCVDRDFDTPPVDGEDPNIDATQIVTIKDINDIRIPGNFVPIAMDKYLSVVVTADDRSGNFFRSIIVQDETGGITLMLDDVELWNRFFVGKRLFIHLNDLWISDYNGLPQLGYAPFIDADGDENLARIPSVAINDIVLPGTSNNPVNAELLTISELNEVHLNTLVTIEGMQLNNNALGSTFADGVNLISVNHTLENCSGQRIIMRTSGFADFATQEVPSGNGSITGIYGVFGSDKQLIMRDVNDISFEDMRCGTMEVEIDESKVISVEEMLTRWSPGQEVALNMDNYIKGSVISDDRAGNFFKSLVVQDATGGIAVLLNAFDLYQSYPRGEVVYIHLQDLCVSDFNGLPQLCYTNSTSNVKRVPENEVPSIVIASGISSPVQASVKKITDLEFQDINTLIRLESVQFNSGSANQNYADAANQFSINHTLEDCDMNEILLRTSGFADFADVKTPNGNGSLTGVLQIFNSDYQMFLRDVADVNMSGSRCGTIGTGDDLDATFEGLVDFSDISLPGWSNIAAKGTKKWYSRNFDNNGFAEVEAYQDTNPETDAWLVTPAINTSETPNFSFRSAMAFYQHDGLTVLVSSDFSGDVSTANWSELSVDIATESDGNYNWVDSGIVDLTSYGSMVYVAFRYVGNAADDTTKIRIDDVKAE